MVRNGRAKEKTSSGTSWQMTDSVLQKCYQRQQDQAGHDSTANTALLSPYYNRKTEEQASLSVWLKVSRMGRQEGREQHSEQGGHVGDRDVNPEKDHVGTATEEEQQDGNDCWEPDSVLSAWSCLTVWCCTLCPMQGHMFPPLHIEPSCTVLGTMNGQTDVDTALSKLKIQKRN